MKLSIIVVSWNVRDDIARCLRSIEENRPSCEFEIIVVDNASSDDSVDVLTKDFPDVVTVVNSENRGFAAANNQGIKAAKGEYILLLNPDTIVHAGALDRLIGFLDDNSDIGVCGPKLLNKDGITYHSIGRFPTFRATLHGKTFFRSMGIFRGYHKKLRTNDSSYDRQTDVDQLSGAALLIRRSVIEEVGLMDESFFVYYEDVDLCLRIRKASWRIVYVPGSLITHIGGRSTVQVSASKRIMLYKSLLIYFGKHRGRLATGLFSLVFKPGVIIREILNIFSGTVIYLISILLGNRKKRLKSLAKIENSAVFLGRYSWKFLFKI